MNEEAASLDLLHDIVELPPVSWWPLAPGWWVVLIVTAILTIAMVFRAWGKWQANAYRRAALRELAAANSVSQIAEILKRTALCANPRVEVAALSGGPWCNWLGQTAGTKVPPAVERSLTAGVFSGAGQAR